MEEVPVFVKEVLDKYIALMNEKLPNTLEGLYIHGSIALDAYEEGSSDLDFVAVTERRLTAEETRILAEIHGEIASKYRKPEMDGAYIIWADFGKLSSDRKNHSFYNGGELNEGPYLNPITWWILKKNGITTLGPERAELDFEVQSHHIVSYVRENMNTYWAQRIQRLENSMDVVLVQPTEVILQEIEWTVLGLLRQFYTLQEHDVISKIGAGEYALQNLPEEWHDIINEAMNIRKGLQSEIYTSDKERIVAAINVSKYIIGICNSERQEHAASTHVRKEPYPIGLL
jgi:hypothetical protein